MIPVAVVVGRGHKRAAEIIASEGVQLCIAVNNCALEDLPGDVIAFSGEQLWHKQIAENGLQLRYPLHTVVGISTYGRPVAQFYHATHLDGYWPRSAMVLAENGVRWGHGSGTAALSLASVYAGDERVHAIGFNPDEYHVELAGLKCERYHVALAVARAHLGSRLEVWP